MNPRELLKQLKAEAAELRKKALEQPGEFTQEDADRADAVILEVTEATKQIERTETLAKSLDNLPSLKDATNSSSENEVLDPGEVGKSFKDGGGSASVSLGEQFVQSDAFKAFKAANPKGIAKGADVNISIKSGSLDGGVIGRKALLRRPTTGNERAVRTNVVDDLVYRPERRLLDVVTRGTTDLAWFQYRQIISKTNNAAIVAEAATTTGVDAAGGLKPLSDLTTTTAEAREYTYADGMEVTNQELSDDGIMRSVIDSTLRENLEIKVENILLNGLGNANEPAGIMNTSGVLQQAWPVAVGDQDPIKQIRKAITKLRVTSNAPIRGVLMNPEDDEAWDLLKDSHGDWLAGPYAPGPGTAWGYERIVSQALPVGRAIIGDFSTIHLLQYSPLEVLAFNQHKDYAQRNLSYIRAEERALQLIRNAARLCIVSLKA